MPEVGLRGMVHLGGAIKRNHSNIFVCAVNVQCKISRQIFGCPRQWNFEENFEVSKLIKKNTSQIRVVALISKQFSDPFPHFSLKFLWPKKHYKRLFGLRMSPAGGYISRRVTKLVNLIGNLNLF